MNSMETELKQNQEVKLTENDLEQTQKAKTELIKETTEETVKIDVAAETVAHQVESTIDNIIEGIKSAAKEAKEKVEPIVENIAEAIENAVENIIEAVDDNTDESNDEDKPKCDTKEIRRDIVKRIDNLYTNQGTDLSITVAEFRKIQNEWKSLSNENPTEETIEIWKEYNALQDKFYDLSKINRELIEYNFKKNLELKNQVCEKAAELLNNDEDIFKAFKALQNLHKEWKEIGAVSKEISDEVWEKFKSISDQINNKYTEFLTKNKERNDEIANTKITWCEEIENLNLEDLTNYKDWENVANRIKEINKLFIVDNITDYKLNQQLYKRLRKTCDNFFEQKSIFYAKKKDEMQANLEKKIVLLAKAEELKESTDWKNTTDKIIELQKEWKSIGPTNHKNSKSTWEQFIAACDYFFEQKNKIFVSKKDEERANLQLKRELIEKIDKFELTADENECLETLKGFYKEYNEIGHVPFKEKDKIYALFKEAIDKQYDLIKIKFHISGRNYGNTRQKLQKKCEQLKVEISTYENNIGFFSSSKKSNSIVNDMERKIKTLKAELAVVIDQLNNFED